MHTKRYKFIVMCLVIGFCTQSLWAGVQDNTIAMITDYGSSARTLALGGVEGVHNGAYAIFENPAALLKDSAQNFSMMYYNLADGESSYFNIGTSFEGWGGHWGFGYAQLRSPNLNYTEADSNSEFYSDSTFAIAESLFSIGYSQSLNPSLSWGASLHYVSQDYFLTKGTGYNLDIGTQWDANPFLVSLTAKNIITDATVTYTDGYTALHFPAELVLSTRYAFSDNFGIYAQVKGPHNLKAAGLRYSPLSSIDFLVGWKEMEATSITQKFTTGISLNLSPARLHFSYQKADIIENSDVFTVSFDYAL